MSPPDSYTIDEALEHLGSQGWGPFQLGILFYAGGVWMGDACEVMILSYVGPAASCEFGLTSSEESVLTSVVFLGMCAGAVMWGAVSDALGRRPAFLLSVAITVLFGFASAVAPTFWWLLVARTLVGVGLSGAPVAYTLLMEFVPGSTRGVWLVAIELFWTIGTVAESALAWGLMNSAGWRWLLVASAAPLVLLLLCAPLLPESPRYLLYRGRLAEAQALLDGMARINGINPLPGQLLPSRTATTAATTTTTTTTGSSGSAEDPASQRLLGPVETTPHSPGRPPGDPAHPPPRPRDGQPPPALAVAAPAAAAAAAEAGAPEAVEAVREALARGRKLFAPPLRHTTLLLLITWLCSALSYYGLVQLVAQLHISAEGGGGTCHGGALFVKPSDFIAILITSTAEIPALALSAAAVQLLGRRRSVAGAAALTAASLVPLMAGAQGGTATASLFLSRLFTMSAFTLLYVYTPELYPTSVRTLGLGTSNACSRLGGLVSPFVAVNLVQAGAPQAAEGCLALASLVACAAVLGIDQETSGKSLEDDVDDGSGGAAVPLGPADAGPKPPSHGAGAQGGSRAPLQRGGSGYSRLQVPTSDQDTRV